jgi:hypothetical protein
MAPTPTSTAIRARISRDNVARHPGLRLS